MAITELPGHISQLRKQDISTIFFNLNPPAIQDLLSGESASVLPNKASNREIQHETEGVTYRTGEDLTFSMEPSLISGSPPLLS